jgi:hypothetical protein
MNKKMGMVLLMFLLVVSVIAVGEEEECRFFCKLENWLSGING